MPSETKNGMLKRPLYEKNSAWYCNICNAKHHTLASHRQHLRRVHHIGLQIGGKEN